MIAKLQVARSLLLHLIFSNPSESKLNWDCFTLSGYNHHIGESVQQQLSELANGGSSLSTNGTSNGVHGTVPGPSSGSTTHSGNDETVYVQNFDDENYHSLPDPAGSHPGYVENSPEFYSSSLLSDKAFSQGPFMTKNYGRSKSALRVLLSRFCMSGGDK